jgi:hypothetical protein
MRRLGSVAMCSFCTGLSGLIRTCALCAFAISMSRSM